MDPNNPIPSNHDQFDVKPAYIKQLIDDDMDRADFDMDLLLKNSVTTCGMTRNGKHRDDDDDEYDYTDIGPETDVDAGEDVHDNNYPLAASSSLDPTPESEKSPVETKERNDNDDERNDNDYSNRDNANVCPMDSVVDDDGDVDNRVRPSDRDVRGADDKTLRDNGDDDDDNDNDARVETADTVVDDDESPPSPSRAAKPLQDALIVADNVADSEDSEDEWDYFRIDPNKQQESAVAAVVSDESRKGVEEQSAQENLESVTKIESPEAENDIKCEELVKDTSSPELINTDISDERKESNEQEKNKIFLDLQEAKVEEDNMDFQLNPEAAEFVPLSPPSLSRNFLQDFAISGSPLKQTQAMDDISIPSQSEFDKEVSYRPKEIGDEFKREYADLQNNSSQNLDVSEISSTKAEMGDDESMMHVMSTSQWQTNISSQWNEKTSDDAGSDLEENDIVGKNNPMAMSLAPSNFEAVFEKNLDLNAVHMLDDSSDGAEQASTPPRSPEPSLSEYTNENREHTLLSEDKNSINVLRASTPQPLEAQPLEDLENSMSTMSSEISSETKASSTAIMHEKEKLSFDDDRYTLSAEISFETKVSSAVTHEKEEVTSEDDRYTPSGENMLNFDEKEIVRTLGISMPVDNYCRYDRFKIDQSEFEKSLEESEEDGKLMKENKEEEKVELCEIEDDKDTSIMKQSAQFLENSQMIEKGSIDSEESKSFPDSTDYSNFNDAIHVSNQYIVQQSLLEKIHPETTSDMEQMHYHANFDSEIVPEKVVETLLDIKDSQSNQSTNLMDICHKTENTLQVNNVKSECTYEDNSHFENERQKEIDEKLYDEDKDDSNKDDHIKPENTTELNVFDSMEKCNFIQDELQHKNQTFVEHVPIETVTLIDKPTEQEQAEEKAAELAPINVEVFKEKVVSEDISSKEVETEPRETAKASPEDTATIDKKEITEIAGASVGAVVAATVAAVAIASQPKTKTIPTTSAKRPTKTTTTKATLAPTTKTVTKSSPTSPSKMISAAMRTTTSPAQSIAKKPTTSTATRPKQLDGSAKAAISSTSGKTTVTKTTTKAATTTMATRTSASPRLNSGTMKSKTTTTTTSSKLTSGAPIEKKSTVSGDARSISKSTTTKPISATLRTTTNTTAKTTLVKTSSTTAKTSASGVTLKPRPASATSAARTTLTSKQPVTGINGASRPRTAPASGGTTKSRDSGGKPITVAKSPLIDKQSKETVNKQISRSGGSATRISGRTSAPIGTATGATKTRTSAGKATGNALASSPTKKTLTSKTASRTTTATKQLSSSETKVLQNGIPKKNVIKAAVITATSKPEDDVPRKDASPVNVPTDNQLIAID